MSIAGSIRHAGLPALLLTLGAALAGPTLAGETTVKNAHSDLVALFTDWRAFEQPPLKDGAPDYTATRSRASTRNCRPGASDWPPSIRRAGPWSSRWITRFSPPR